MFSNEAFRAAEKPKMVAHPKPKTYQGDSADGRRQRQEQALDEALKNTFPASDPVSIEQPAAGESSDIESRQ
jgi:hypothetical protein